MAPSYRESLTGGTCYPTHNIDELNHQGLSLSVRDKAEWVTILEQHKANVADCLVDLGTADSAIESIIFDAYELDQRERDEVRMVSLST